MSRSYPNLGALRQFLRGRLRGGGGQVRRGRGDERLRQPRRPPRRQRLHQGELGR